MNSPYGFPQVGNPHNPSRLVVRAVALAAIALLTACSVSQDGVTLAEGDLILLPNQTDSTENGVYRVGAVSGDAAPLTRAEGARFGVEFKPGATVYVTEGTVGAGTDYVLTTTGPVILGTTQLTYQLVAGPSRKAVLRLPIAAATANNAVLFTVPSGRRLKIDDAMWEVVTAFTGGTASAIGLSSSQTPHDTAGDLLGGGTGDVAAALTAGTIGGTLGVSFGTNGKAVLEAGSTIIFNRIASAFTAGAGYALITGTWLS